MVVQPNQVGPALPVSAGAAALLCFPVGCVRKGSFGKRVGKPLTSSSWPTFGDGETEVRVGTRKSKAGLNPEGRAAWLRPEQAHRKICGSGPMWTGRWGIHTPAPCSSPGSTPWGCRPALCSGSWASAHRHRKAVLPWGFHSSSG